MTRDEFKRQLEMLQVQIFQGLVCHAVWHRLYFHEEGEAPPSIEETNRVFERFKSFFKPVRVALQDTMLLQFAKVFDTDSGAISLPNLLAAARKDNPNLAPTATTQELREISRLIKGVRATLKNKLRPLRHKRLAHTDPQPQDVSFQVSELDSLVDTMKEAFNRLSSAHNNEGWHWGLALDEVSRATTDILSILAEAENRRLAELVERKSRRPAERRRADILS